MHSNLLALTFLYEQSQSLLGVHEFYQATSVPYHTMKEAGNSLNDTLVAQKNKCIFSK